MDLKLRLSAIAYLVEKRKQLDKEQEKEIRLIEKNFNNVFCNCDGVAQIFIPYLSATNDIVNGVRVPNAEETEKVDLYLAVNEKEHKESYLKVCSDDWVGVELGSHRELLEEGTPELLAHQGRHHEEGWSHTVVVEKGGGQTGCSKWWLLAYVYLRGEWVLHEWCVERAVPH